MKLTSKRILSLVLVFALVLSLAPAIALPAKAATISGLADTSIGVSGTANRWTVGSNSLSGTLTGGKLGSIYFTATETLTIKNDKSAKAILSFNFSVSGGFNVGSYVTIDGVDYKSAVTNAAFEKELAAGGSVTVKLTADKSSSGANTIKANLTNISLVLADAGDVALTLEAPAYGSYTVTYGESSQTMAAGTASAVLENPATTAYTFSATPGSGYKLMGWYNVTTGAYLSTDATLTTMFDQPCTMKAIIIPATTPVFYVGGAYILGLAEALDYAAAGGHTLISLHDGGTVPAGNYTIPSGVTLLMPQDNKHTPVGSSPEVTTTNTSPTAYETLTLAEGVTITVENKAAIECEATLNTMQGNKLYGGRPSGKYGAIYMSPNSVIELNSGSNLYVWGYIYGDGAVNANPGSKVYESFQAADFLGGSNLSVFVDTNSRSDDDGDGNPTNDYIKSFFVSQYYIQNIEVPLTVHAGATAYMFAAMTVSSVDVKAPPTEFIGANGLFVPKNGSVVKDYDPSTDRLIVQLNGDADIRSINIDMSDTSYKTILEMVVGTSSFNSANYILGLNSNMTIHANSGYITLYQDIVMQPGVEMYVNEAATLHIADAGLGDAMNNLTIYGTGGHNVYVFDYENWGGYVFGGNELRAMVYSPTTGRYKRTAADLKDVLVDVNGTVICDGYLYSTVTVDENGLPVSGGANVISSNKTGKIVMNNGAGIEDFVYCIGWDGGTALEAVVDVDSIWLKNGDGTYLLTDGAEAGTVILYCETDDCWFMEDQSQAVVTEATCTAGGYTTYTCACGETYVANEVDALGHSWTNASCTLPKTCSRCGITEGSALGHSYNAVVTAPTCTTAGYTTYTCACGDSYVADEVDALGHNYSSVTVDATCTENGSVTYTCDNCGDTYVETISATGHSYNSVVTAPTCTTGGYTTYTCGTCGDSYVADEVDALGHSYNAVVTAPTCTAAGYTTYTCSCGDSYVADEVAALGHNYEAVVTAPDCVNAGYTTYTCSCGDSYVADEVAALGHNYSSVTVDATCTENGSVTYTCDNCGDTYVETISATGHSYNAVVTDPDCVNAGYTTYTCACGDSYVADEVAALGHSYNAVVTAPTCTAAGYTTYTCSCGDSYVADEVAALGHNYSSVTVDATCTENGSVTYTCDNCGDTYVETISATGHSYNAVVTAPTCTAAGYTTYTCSACGDSYVGDEAAALGHNYEAVVTAPDCVNAGYTTYTCACGDSYTEAGEAALGHDYEAVVTAPDCVNAGYTTYTCSACGDSYVGDEVDALGHASVSYSFANNVHTFTCDVCGQVAFTKTEGKKFNIASAAPVLADDIVMKYNCNIPAGFEVGYMVFEFNGESYYVYDYEYDAKNDRYAFKFPGINPQKMGDNICATVYAYVEGYEVSAQIASYSMVKYLDNQLKKTTLPDSTRTIFSDVLAYGEAAQILQGYKTDALVSTLLSASSTLTPSTFPESLPDSLNLQKRFGEADSRVQYTGVTLSLGSKMAVRVSVTCTDLDAFTYKVEISGREYTYTGEDLVPVNDGSDGKYYLYFNQVKASELGEKITFTVWEGDTQVSYTIEYSVYTFVQKNYTKGTEATKNMLKAIYIYGESVKNA